MSGVRQRDYQLVDANLESELEYCLERGLDTWTGYLLAHRARMELDRGRWDAAGDSAALVLRNPRSPPIARTWALPTLGLLRARRGDADSDPPLAGCAPARGVDRRADADHPRGGRAGRGRVAGRRSCDGREGHGRRAGTRG